MREFCSIIRSGESNDRGEFAHIQLSITFSESYDENDQLQEVSYEITDSDNVNYLKMIKVTDGQYTKKIYIRVVEW